MRLDASFKASRHEARRCYRSKPKPPRRPKSQQAVFSCPPLGPSNKYLAFNAAALASVPSGKVLVRVRVRGREALGVSCQSGTQLRGRLARVFPITLPSPAPGEVGKSATSAELRAVGCSFGATEGRRLYFGGDEEISWQRAPLRATPAWSARGVTKDARKLALRGWPGGTAVQTFSVLNGSDLVRMMPSKFPEMIATEHFSVLVGGYYWTPEYTHPRKRRTRAPVLTGGPGAASAGVASKNGQGRMRIQSGVISYSP